jgi:hypothetical protein
VTEYAIWRHEGGIITKQEQFGTFSDKDKAKEKCDELNQKVNIVNGGYRVQPEH